MYIVNLSTCNCNIKYFLLFIGWGNIWNCHNKKFILSLLVLYSFFQFIICVFFLFFFFNSETELIEGCVLNSWEFEIFNYYRALHETIIFVFIPQFKQTFCWHFTRIFRQYNIGYEKIIRVLVYMWIKGNFFYVRDFFYFNQIKNSKSSFLSICQQIICNFIVIHKKEISYSKVRVVTNWQKIDPIFSFHTFEKTVISLNQQFRE